MGWLLPPTPRLRRTRWVAVRQECRPSPTYLHAAVVDELEKARVLRVVIDGDTDGVSIQIEMGTTQ